MNTVKCFCKKCKRTYAIVPANDNRLKSGELNVCPDCGGKDIQLRILA
jgi:DNA-directed RNA polymerase subunit RPC12/RpoP